AHRPKVPKFPEEKRGGIQGSRGTVKLSPGFCIAQGGATDIKGSERGARDRDGRAAAEVTATEVTANSGRRIHVYIVIPVVVGEYGVRPAVEHEAVWGASNRAVGNVDLVGSAVEQKRGVSAVAGGEVDF